MNAANELRSVVVDASVIIALCAKEPDKYEKTRAALQGHIEDGAALHAPHLVVMETLYVLCSKRQAQVLTDTEHAAAIANFDSALTIISFPSDGDASLIARAERIRQGYGCSRSADSLYIALAEQLAASGPAELLTFDAGQQRQAAENAPSVTVTLLVP